MNNEIMMTTAERLSAALDDAQTPPLSAVNWGQLIEVNNAMGNAVNRAVCRLAREIIQHHDRRLMLCEIVLQRQDLSSVAQRALGQETDLGEAVDHHPFWFDALNFLKNAFRGLAQSRSDQ